MFKKFLLALVVATLCFSAKLHSAEGDVWFEPSSVTVSPGQNFDLEIHVDSGSQKVGAYQFKITFDPSVIIVDTSQGTDGVEAGSDGFLTVVNTDNVASGELVVNGFDINGKGPGSDLHLLTVYFKSQNISGTQSTNVALEIQSLTNELGQDFPSPNAQSAQVVVTPGVQLSVTMEPYSESGNVGSISSSPSGIDCPGTCTYYFDYGSEVTITATPAQGYRFDHWEGDCSGESPSCILTMDSDKSAIAYFKCNLGDVNCDGQVNIIDALLIARKAVGLPMEGTGWCAD